MKYLAGLKKVTALLSTGAEPLESLRAILETAADCVGGQMGELCIPSRQLESIADPKNKTAGEIALGNAARITGSGDALENAAKCKKEGDPVAFMDGSHVVLSLSCGTLTVYEPRIDTLSYTSQVLSLKILADLADEVLRKSLEKIDAAERLDSKTRACNQLVQRNMMLRELAMFDELTGLYNMRFFQHRLESELANLEKRGDSFGIALVVLDYLENIKGRFGHATSDAAIRHVGKIAGQNIRTADILARRSLCDFAILFPDTALSRAQESAEHLRAAVDNSLLEFEDKRIHLSISVGVTSISKGFKKTAPELFRALEESLSAGSDKDHNRVVAVDG